MLPWAAEGDKKKFDCDKSVPSLLQTTKNVLYEHYCFWNLEEAPPSENPTSAPDISS